MGHRPRRISRVSAASTVVRSARVGVLGLALWLAGPPAVSGAPWEATVGELGRTAHRYALHIGGSYGVLTGSEVHRTESGPGFEAAASFRIRGSISVYGGFAWHTANVKGQLASILDTTIRPDGRSATVEGKVRSPRLRGGIRVDAYRMQDWKFQVYLLGGLLYSKVEATLDSIDGAPPVPYQAPNGVLVDPGNITTDPAWLLGLFGRVGVDYPLGTRFAVDANFTFETIDPPPGTNDLSTFTLGGTFRF